MNTRTNTATGGANAQGEGGTGAAPPETPFPAPPASEPVTGIALAVDLFRKKHDPDAFLMWKAKGPRNTTIANIGAIMAQVGDDRRIYVVAEYEAGNFKLFGELPGRDEAAVNALAAPPVEPAQE